MSVEGQNFLGGFRRREFFKYGVLLLPFPAELKANLHINPEQLIAQGTLILSKSDGIYAADLEGNIRTIRKTQIDSLLVLSEDNNNVVFTSTRQTDKGGARDLYSIDLISGEEFKLTNESDLVSWGAFFTGEKRFLFKLPYPDPAELSSYYEVKTLPGGKIVLEAGKIIQHRKQYSITVGNSIWDLYIHTTENGDKIPLYTHLRSRGRFVMLYFRVPVISQDGSKAVFSLKDTFNELSPAVFYVSGLNFLSASRVNLGLEVVEPVYWTNDNNRLLFIGNKGQEKALYTVDGQVTKLFPLPGDFESFLWKPEGQLNVKEESPTEAIVPSQTTKPQVAETKEVLAGRTGIVFVPGLTSIVEGVGGGIESSGKFSELTAQARKQGFKGQDFSTMSWGGVTVDKKGLAFAKPSTCEDTLKSPVERGKMLRLHTLDRLTVRPNDKIVFMSDSDGYTALVSFMEITVSDIEKDPNFPIKPENMSFIFVHPPALGVDKPGLSALTMLFTQGCKLGPSPSPSVFTSPAGVNLLSSWENKEKTEERVERVVSWWRERGARVAAVGNKDDLVISIRRAVLSNVAELLEEEEEWLVESFPNQEVPGAENYLLELGIGGKMLGHDRVWKTAGGQRLLLKLIGSQIK